MNQLYELDYDGLDGIYGGDAYDSILNQVTPTRSGVVLQDQKKYRSITRQSTEAVKDKEKTVKISEVMPKSTAIPLTEKILNQSSSRDHTLSQTPHSTRNEKFPKQKKIKATELMLSYEFKQTLAKGFAEAERANFLGFCAALQAVDSYRRTYL